MDPTSEPMRLRLRGAAVFAASALLAAGCGGGGSGASGAEIGAEELARFASTSAEAASGRFSFEMSLTLAGADEAFAVSGEGAFDAAADRTSAAFDLSSLARFLGGLLGGAAAPGAVGGLPDFRDPAGWKIEVVHDHDIGYLRFPALDEKLPDGKSWFRVDEGDTSVGGLEFGALEQFTTNDPREVLAFLHATTSEIETVGTERLGGVATTHYRAVVDPAELHERASSGGQPAQSLVDRLVSEPGLDEIPVDVWVDAEGLVRKLSLVLSRAEPATSGPGEVSMLFDLWDYGEDVEIDLPPSSDVANG